jgi:hypothetical protein
MSILDDAIREHLELKRAHGADDSEVKRLEDEAFGPPQRPDEVDPFAEAPTEFLVAPGETPADLPEVADEAERSGRRPNITDLQEPPSAAAPVVEDELSPAPDAPPPSPADAADAPLPPPVDAAPAADEEHPAGEHEIVADPGPSTEERHVIADQPTQMFDVQAEMDAEAPAAAAEQPSPTDEQLVEAAQEEPNAAPPPPEEPAAAFPPTAIHEQPPLQTRGPDAEVAGHPPAEAAPEEESAEYDFLNEQRLADELDQALEAPITDEHGLPTYEDAAPAAGGGIFDFESAGETYEDDPSEEALRRMPAPEPPSEEAARPAPEPPSEEAAPPAPEPPSEEAPQAGAEPPSEETDYAFDPDTGQEDVLEGTPKFLEDAPEDDDLWFEQKPPKDFDLD